MESFPELDSREAIQGYITTLAEKEGVALDDPKLAAELDKRDKLVSFRSKFHVPTVGELLGGDEAENGVCISVHVCVYVRYSRSLNIILIICAHIGIDTTEDCLYFTGNSLGLQPKGAKELVVASLDKWAKKGVMSHFVDPYPYLPIEDILVEESARIVGAKPLEVITMNGLTVNCHLAMVSYFNMVHCGFNLENVPAVVSGWGRNPRTNASAAGASS